MTAEKLPALAIRTAWGNLDGAGTYRASCAKDTSDLAFAFCGNLTNLCDPGHGLLRVPTQEKQ